jgi:hypothetical protein
MTSGATHPTATFVRIAGENTDFAYYLCNDGTPQDRERDMEKLYLFMGMGYRGFAPDGFEGVITLYRPFSLGIGQKWADAGISGTHRFLEAHRGRGMPR